MRNYKRVGPPLNLRRVGRNHRHGSWPTSFGYQGIQTFSPSAREEPNTRRQRMMIVPLRSTKNYTALHIIPKRVDIRTAP